MTRLSIIKSFCCCAWELKRKRERKTEYDFVRKEISIKKS